MSLIFQRCVFLVVFVSPPSGLNPKPSLARRAPEPRPSRRVIRVIRATHRASDPMIEQLRRVVRENPSLEPFASGATHATTTTNRDDDARGIRTTTFDAVAYAREAFSRSRAVAGASADASVGSTTTTNVLEDVATLAEGAREIERLIRDEVRSKRETLDDALRGVSEAETTVQTIRDGAEEIAEAMRRVARELREPHDAVEATTKTLERIAATGETLRAATKIIKLANKLDECSLTTNCEDASRRRRDASELSKAAKLLGEIKVTLDAAGGSLDGVDVVDERMAFIRARTVEVRREANEALDLGMEASSQADVGAALQVFNNLHELTAVVDARVAACASSAVDAFKDALDAEAVGRTARSGGAESSGHERRGGRHLVAPPHGEEHAWIDALWRRVDAAMDAAHENAMSVWHLQRVLAKKRDPLTQTLFLDEVVGKSASSQALCDRFWAVFCKGLSEHLSRAHAAAGFVAGALRKGFPRLVGALEGVVAKAGRDADAAKGAPGCTRRDGATRAQALRAVEPIAAAFFTRSLTRLTDAANNCFAGGRVVDAASVDAFLSRIRTEIDAVAEYDNLLNNACGNASLAFKALADRAKRSISRSVDASSLAEEATQTQRNNAQIARELNRSHELMSKVLPSFASAPRHALEVGLEHVASAVAESTRPLFDAVGDFCDARFAQMHAVERSSASSAKDTSAQHIIATVSMLQLSSNAHGDVFSAARGPLFAARLALAERVLRSFVTHASLIRKMDTGAKMRLVKECDEISHAVATHLRVSGSEADSPAFKSIKAFKSLVLLPTENIEASPLVRDVDPRALLHHLYSRAPADALSTPAERASVNAAQYASRLLNKMNDAEVWRGVKATLDVYDETAKTGRDGADAVVTLMRAVGERLAKK